MDAKEESAGSGTPQTVRDGSQANGAELGADQRAMSWTSEDNQQWDRHEDEEDRNTPSMFPSARVDMSGISDPAEGQNDITTDGDEEGSKELTAEEFAEGPSKGVKSRKRVFTTKVDPSSQRKRTNDGEWTAKKAKLLEKRNWAQSIVQKACSDDLVTERYFFFEPIVRDGLVLRPEFVPGTGLRNELLEDLLSLTRANMKEMYDNSRSEMWAWSDARKRGELRNDRMRWIILRGYQPSSTGSEDEVEVEGAPTPESGEKGILGFVAFRFTAEVGIPHAYIHELQIWQQAQGKGLGKELLECVEYVSRDTNMQLVMLTVFSSNVQAVRFYDRNGFEVDEASPGPCYNLLDGPLASRAPYEIMSKVLDRSVLQYKCEECDYACRFEDTLMQHAGLKHHKEFPFKCTVEGCGLGTVHLHQLYKHNEIKHGIAPPPTVSSMMTRRASQVSTSKASVASAEESTPSVDYINARVTLKANGRKGTVLKSEKGFYSVRMDGQVFETIVCRATAFVGHKHVPVKKKVIDPDHELALKLQYEDGWARKSSRVNRNAPL